VSAYNHLCLGGEDFFIRHASAHLKEPRPARLVRCGKNYWYGDERYVAVAGDRRSRQSMEGHEGLERPRRVADWIAEGFDKKWPFRKSFCIAFILKDFRAANILRANTQTCAAAASRATGVFIELVLRHTGSPGKRVECVGK